MRFSIRRCMFLAATTVAIAAICLPYSLRAGEEDARRPNVVLIISDDQAWTDYGFMGHTDIKTPHLDRLASQSVVFPRGYVPTALCRPSLLTIITGLYAHQHRTSGNDPAPLGPDGERIPADQYQRERERLIAHVDRHPTLPRLLAKEGYSSFQSGKWWEGSYRRGGFTEGMTHGDPARGGRHGDEGLEIGRRDMRPVLDFIDRCGERPFFLWYAPFLPHSPHNPPERLLNKYAVEGRPPALARYYAMCEWFDETCGQLLRHLDERGLSEDTLVVYVTDNGWIQRTSRTATPDGWRHAFAPRSKQSPYEGGTRTPIMLRRPGRLKPETRSEVVSSIDLAPTILAACGVSPPPDLPGVDLLKVTQGESLSRDAIFGEGFAHDIADIDDPRRSLLYRWCIRDRWKLLLTYDGQTRRYRSAHPDLGRGPQLFDLLADPHEKKDLAGENPELVAELARRIDAWCPLDELKPNGIDESENAED